MRWPSISNLVKPPCPALSPERNRSGMHLLIGVSDAILLPPWIMHEDNVVRIDHLSDDVARPVAMVEILDKQKIDIITRMIALNRVISHPPARDQ